MKVAATALCSVLMFSLLAKDSLPDLSRRISSSVSSVAVSAGACPGSLVLAESNTYPLAFGRINGFKAPVAAAAVYGKGRVTVLTHNGFIDKKAVASGGNGKFLREIVLWLSGGRIPTEIFYDAKISGTEKSLAAVFGDVKELRFSPVRTYRELSALPKNAVFLTMPDSHTAEDAKRLTAFIKAGGRVLCSVVGWGWHQITGKPISESPFNVAMGPVGIFSSRMIANPVKGGCFEVFDSTKGKPVYVDDAIKFFDFSDKKVQTGDALKQNPGRECIAAIESFADVLPRNDEKWRPRIEALSSAAAGDAVPSPATPFDSSRLRERLAYILFQRAWLANPESLWPASNAAKVYPGVPDGNLPRVTREVKIDLSIPRWHGTGLFAAAGESLKVSIPDGAEKLGLRVRVGTTTCGLTNHSTWRRAPVVSVEIPLRKRITEFSSPFGGLVYIVVPGGLKGERVVKIGNVCQAARFVEGVDTPETWAKQLRERRAPMAELENADIVLTVPFENVRDLADPRPLLETWSEILACDAKLTGIPKKRQSPERICADIQLCAGYMHAGYPIMIPLHSARHLVNNRTIRTAAVDDVWGLFHEMGHNHQNYDWTFHGTGEVTVNFFSLYCFEKISGRKNVRDNHKIGGEKFKKHVEAWYAKGKPFDQWKSDPFLALDFFARLIEKYGWESFEKLFAEYRALPKSERPKTDLEKRQQWCRRYSKIVGEDLTEEFRFMLEN